MELLSHEEVRIIGSLIEKQYTTPAYYPMTVNSITNACNQKSSRNPIVSYDESLVEDTLNELRDKQLVAIVTGTEFRVLKYSQSFKRHYDFSHQEIAVICVLLLRGAQTVGEIRSRTNRIYDFKDLSEVHETLDKLTAKEGGPFIFKLPKDSGREHRYTHLFCGEPEVSEVESKPYKLQVTSDQDAKIEKLENEVVLLKDDIEKLKEEFAEFKKQFE